MKSTALVAGLASTTLMLGAGSASATVTNVEVQGSKLIVQADGGEDFVQFVVSDGKLAIFGVTKTTLDANTSAEIVVEANGGADEVNAGALGPSSYKSLDLSGGEGNDKIIGGGGGDRITGGAGNDVLIGRKGNDTISGGSGADSMIWINGDGSDIDEGGADFDLVETEGNGEAEIYRYAPKGAETEVHLERLPNAEGNGAFSIDLNAEALNLHGLGGNDRFEAAALGLDGRTQLIVSGGEGDDTIEGGNGEDGLFGEDGNDEVVINGSPTNGDVITYKAVNAGDANNPRVLVARTEPDPFTVELEAEKLTVNGVGGEDTMTPEPTSPTGLATRTTLTLDGGAGEDTLLGSEGDDTLVGGAGNDVIEGAAGNDRLLSRDHESDLVGGGAGEDSAQTDELTVDTVRSVEHIDAVSSPMPTPLPPGVPQPDTRALLPTLGKTRVDKVGKRLIAKVPLTCPADETGGCRTTLRLETAKPVRLGTRRAVVVLGSKSLRLASGERRTASIRLAPGAAALARQSKLGTKILIVSNDIFGNTASASLAVTLKIPRR